MHPEAVKVPVTASVPIYFGPQMTVGLVVASNWPLRWQRCSIKCLAIFANGVASRQRLPLV